MTCCCRCHCRCEKLARKRRADAMLFLLQQLEKQVRDNPVRWVQGYAWYPMWDAGARRFHWLTPVCRLEEAYVESITEFGLPPMPYIAWRTVEVVAR